ncbi:MAG: hypothetical protein KDC35_08275 [Acidobacteria bacterium]|nr:hypothetical protein [Acidobacteriota bacterium]
MPALNFSHYFMMGNEGAPFDVGNCVQLDPYEGFYDQSLEHLNTGDSLIILVTDDLLNPNAECHHLRYRLLDTPIVSGSIQCLEVRDNYLFHIADRKTFEEWLKEKPTPTENEIINEVLSLVEIWDRVRHQNERFAHYRFTIVVGLPTISSLHESREKGVTCVSQFDFGMKHPRQKGFPLLLEPSSDGRYIRITVIGSNTVDSCRVFDVTDIDEYRNMLIGLRDRALTPEERNCWEHLLM